MNLRMKRIEKGMTQEEIAAKVGIIQSQISRYEAGISEPNLETLKKLASILDCTVDELLKDPKEGSDGE